jgi:hypothetical protein|tara:strand:+ start:51 stop:203 length:153 start_codon:yes stop_codon:yes gene_type:complete
MFEKNNGVYSLGKILRKNNEELIFDMEINNAINEEVKKVFKILRKLLFLI